MKSVFITGASSGIGESLAYYFAKEGAIVGIAARRKNRLKKVAEKIKKYGGTSIIFQLDVSNEEATKQAIDKFLNETKNIDIVIANAGVGGTDKLSSGDAKTINKILAINILGITNTIIPFIPIMKEQKSGRICIISSVAGTRGLIGHGGYAASKAAIRVLGDSWDYSLKRHNIATIVIFPGWIATEMTAKNKYKMFFLMDSDTAAKKIAIAIKNKKRKYILPWQWKIIVPIFRIIPRWFIKFFSL
tara:strand:+ start:818 stop:1555 length:738 start_codon:yes stop_codon:yes gene_type:complete